MDTRQENLTIDKVEVEVVEIYITRQWSDETTSSSFAESDSFLHHWDGG